VNAPQKFNLQMSACVSWNRKGWRFCNDRARL